MSDQSNRGGHRDGRGEGVEDGTGDAPRVLMMETSAEAVTRPDESLAPRLIETAQTGRIVPAPPVGPQLVLPARPQRSGGVVRLGLAGLGVAFVGWAGVDIYLWLASAFAHSATLGWVATAAAACGVAGAALVIARELKSFFALKSVEANQQRIAGRFESGRRPDTQEAIRNVLAGIPKDRESMIAIEAFQRKMQPHHSPTQQVELLSQTVMATFDRRAEAIVRRAGARAFGITAISPTAMTDALFFIACSIRMVRGIAACYGHRPTMSATVHLLRRVMVEGGKLGAIDLAAATLTQHVAGAVAERVAASAAESMYAAQRMARLGLVTMGLCRPVPFRPHEIPGILPSLLGNLFASRAQSGQEDKGG